MTSDLQQKALDLWQQGLSTAQIADMLNTEGHRTVTGAEFQATTVWRMISRAGQADDRSGGVGGEQDRRMGGGSRERAAEAEKP